MSYILSQEEINALLEIVDEENDCYIEQLQEITSAVILIFHGEVPKGYTKTKYNFAGEASILNEYDKLVQLYLLITGINIKYLQLNDIVYMLLNVFHGVCTFDEYKKLILDMGSSEFHNLTYNQRLFKVLVRYIINIQIKKDNRDLFIFDFKYIR